jgi:NAD(P)-dependent dehydrogenase (short-subunit alcohol dehydrogenase family)
VDIAPDQLDICAAVLQQLAEDPSLIEQDHRLKPLLTKIHYKLRRAERKKQKQQDRQFKATAIIVQQHNLGYQQRLLTPSPVAGFTEAQHRTLNQSQTCYICKRPYTQLHHFYHLLCPDCADLNYQKRQQCANLNGRTALLTGGRIKIGYQTGLRLLRDGARVLVTTRFPGDCADRYRQEADFAQWHDRLHIYGLDLRNLTALEAFIQYLLQTEPAIDILINNAAQTIKRPLAFYQPLLDQEYQRYQCLPPEAQVLISNPGASPFWQMSLPSLDDSPTLNTAIATLPPWDADGQPFDLRVRNSWSLKLDQVSSLELVEVQLVNAIAPFMLNSQLKPLLLQSPFARRFIINVSAMEGQFNRDRKTVYHPHTNMAKAALNMITRTAAEDYAQDCIFMNSVDTGWITDENPYPKKMHLQQERGFYTPLDVIDGMARIYDPIVQGIEQAETPLSGYFLKDYIPYPW